LKQAWKDAPLATFNPDIHSVLTGEWDNLIFPGHDDQSLQEILYCEEGWTGTGLLEVVSLKMIEKIEYFFALRLSEIPRAQFQSTH